MAGISDRELNDLEAQTQGEDHSESELMPEEDIYKGDWYVVHTYSGYENKIKEDLTKRVASMNMEDKIFSVFVPEVEKHRYVKIRRKSLYHRRAARSAATVEQNICRNHIISTHTFSFSLCSGYTFSFLPRKPCTLYRTH